MAGCVKSGLVLLSVLSLAASLQHQARPSPRPQLTTRHLSDDVLFSFTRRPWWSVLNRGDLNNLVGDVGSAEMAVDVKKAFAFSKWCLPPTLQADEIGSVSEDICPLLCFVNRDSGGRRGKALLDSLRSLSLNPLQVCDLKDSPPGSRLELFKPIASRVNILCCGGDGTINWVMDELSRLNMTVGSFGLIPLGTGNDLYLQTFQRTLQEQQQILTEAASAAMGAKGATAGASAGGGDGGGGGGGGGEGGGRRGGSLVVYGIVGCVGLLFKGSAELHP